MNFQKTILACYLIFILSGCVANAKEEFNKLQIGMSKNEIMQVLGSPEEIQQVLFNGHERDYEIWQYNLVPNNPICPSEAIPRFTTAMVTAGLSEIIWTRAKAEPHWIYFLDGLFVYSSLAFDCANSGLCKVQKNKIN